MKKKIKDLTLEEATKICEKNLHCDKCPLLLFIKRSRTYCYHVFLLATNGKKVDLDKEVEIDESNNANN